MICQLKMHTISVRASSCAWYRLMMHATVYIPFQWADYFQGNNNNNSRAVWIIPRKWNFWRNVSVHRNHRYLKCSKCTDFIIASDKPTHFISCICSVTDYLFWACFSGFAKASHIWGILSKQRWISLSITPFISVAGGLIRGRDCRKQTALAFSAWASWGQIWLGNGSQKDTHI